MISTIINFINQISSDQVIKIIREISPNSKHALLGTPDKLLLHELSKNLSAGSVVVEIGIYLGSSSAILAHANPSIELHAYDLFDDHAYDDTHEALLMSIFGPGKTRSLKNVASLLTNYSNITLHKVDYLEEPTFNKPIDLFIEDASHHNPQLENTLKIWLPRVKTNGIVLIHDYRPWLEGQHRYFPDVIECVNNLISSKEWKFHGAVGSYAILEKII